MKTCETCGQRWLVIHRCDDSETAKQDQEMQRLQIVTPDRTECEHGGLKRKCRTCELEAELRQWNTEFPGGLGQAQQAKHMAIAAVKAIGAVYEETSPSQIAEAFASRDAEIAELRKERDNAYKSIDKNWVTHQRIVKAEKALAEAHRRCCTPENCVLDGGPEHAAAFLAKGETDVS